MNTSDAAVVARWTAKLVKLRADLAFAKRQVAYWVPKARKTTPLTTAGKHARAELADRRAKVKRLEADIVAAKKVIARHKSTAATKMSDKGLAMLIREEGSVPYAYNDPAGHATFGVGHLIHLGRVTAADQARWGTKSNPKPGLVKPTLAADIVKYEKAVRDAVRVNLTQQEFDACVSLAFNIGTGGFASSKVVKRLNAGDDRGAADAFLMWDKPSMLRPRRERERKLFLTGQYA